MVAAIIVLVGGVQPAVDGRVRTFMMPCQGQNLVLKPQRLFALVIAKATMLEVIRNDENLDGTRVVEVFEVVRGWALVRMAALRGHREQRPAAGTRQLCSTKQLWGQRKESPECSIKKQQQGQHGLRQ